MPASFTLSGHASILVGAVAHVIDSPVSRRDLQDLGAGVVFVSKREWVRLDLALGAIAP